LRHDKNTKTCDKIVRHNDVIRTLTLVW